MGLIDNARAAADLAAQRAKVEAAARATAEWENRVNRARSWWNENIAEPAEFRYPRSLSHRHCVIAVCDGWSFLLGDSGRIRRHYGAGGVADADRLAAFLVQSPRWYGSAEQTAENVQAYELFRRNAYHLAPCYTLADIGQRLAEWDERQPDRLPPDPDFIGFLNPRWTV